MIIDAHSHMGPALEVQGPLYPAPDGKHLVELMDRARIDKACLFAPLWIGGPFIDPEFKEANGAVYQAAREFPDRIIGYGRIDPKFGQEALDELDRCIQDYRFRGLKLHPDTEGFKTNDLDLLGPVFERLDQSRIVAFFHGGYFPTCHPALFAPLARAFPNVPIIIAHLGYRHWADAAILAREVPNIYLDTAGNSTPTSIMGAIRIAGAHKVLLGTDAPYHEPWYCRDKVELLPELSEEEKRLVTGGNMARILGLAG